MVLNMTSLFSDVEISVEIIEKICHILAFWYRERHDRIFSILGDVCGAEFEEGKPEVSAYWP